MDLELNNKDLKNYIYLNKINICKLLIYILIAIIFYYFMQTYSPLGINLRTYHYERIVNAIRNIFEKHFQERVLGILNPNAHTG